LNSTTTNLVPIHDRSGSTIALINSTTGSINTFYIYDPFGAVTIASNFPFLYDGMEYDGATGLYHTQNRYYAPHLPRWLSEHPIGVRGGSPDFMTFVNNDPINRIDPFGNVDTLGDPLTTTTIGDRYDLSTESPVLVVSQSPSDIALDIAQNDLAGQSTSPGVLGSANSGFTDNQLQSRQWQRLKPAGQLCRWVQPEHDNR
jgi:RHS repeat-associated protein